MVYVGNTTPCFDFSYNPVKFCDRTLFRGSHIQTDMQNEQLFSAAFVVVANITLPKLSLYPFKSVIGVTLDAFF